MNFNEHIIKELPNEYAGSEKKRTVILDDNQKYLLKFPDPIREQNREISYINNAFSEYLGCKIAQSIGLPVQEVTLGEYAIDDKVKIACACKDIRQQGISMHPIEILELGSLDAHKTSASFQIAEDIISKFDKNIQDSLRKLYAQTFILDTLINNKDRHNGNWAVLYDGEQYQPCPIFDCGSSFFPLLSDADLSQISPSTLAMGATSALLNHNGNHINYHSFWKEDASFYLTNTLKEMIGNIDLVKFNHIIQETPYISDERKNFYSDIISVNYEKTLLPALEIALRPQEISERSNAELYNFYKKNIEMLKMQEPFQKVCLTIGDIDKIFMKVSNRYGLLLNIDTNECEFVLPIRSKKQEIAICYESLSHITDIDNIEIQVNDVTTENLLDEFDFEPADD